MIQQTYLKVTEKLKKSRFGANESSMFKFNNTSSNRSKSNSKFIMNILYTFKSPPMNQYFNKCKSHRGKRGILKIKNTSNVTIKMNDTQEIQAQSIRQAA